MSALPALIEHVEHFRKRVVQDALAQATATYWHRRADQFEAALPRPGDFIGNATEDEREVRRQRITECVRACRHRAAVSLIKDDE